MWKIHLEKATKQEEKKISYKGDKKKFNDHL